MPEGHRALYLSASAAALLGSRKHVTGGPDERKTFRGTFGPCAQSPDGVRVIIYPDTITRYTCGRDSFPLARCYVLGED